MQCRACHLHSRFMETPEGVRTNPNVQYLNCGPKKLCNRVGEKIKRKIGVALVNWLRLKDIALKVPYKSREGDYAIQS